MAERFMWRGHEWLKQTWGGAPTFNGVWSPDNVVLNEDDSITLKITNPTGSEPVAAAFQSVRRGWGYGTYMVVVETNFDDIPRSVVFGNLFTYDGSLGKGSGANELDLGEISHWGQLGSSRPSLSATVWRDDETGDNSPEKAHAFALRMPPGVSLHTYVMEWTPEGVSFAAYKGRGTGGERIAQGRITENVPTPAGEVVIFNMWVISVDDDATKTPYFEAKIADFLFVPLGQEPEPPPVEPEPPKPDPEPPVEPPKPEPPAPEPPEPEPPVEPEPEEPDVEKPPPRRCESCGRCRWCGKRKGRGHRRFCRRKWQRMKRRLRGS